METMEKIGDLPFPIKRQVVSVAFPTVGGLGVGFFGCLLSYSKNQKKRFGHHTRKTRCAQAIATMGSFGFSLFSLVPLALGAPINIVNVVRAGALLPANAVFSQVFGLRPLLKDDYIGTLVTISGVVSFIMFVGPPAPERTLEEFIKQVTRPAPVSYSVVVLALFFGSAGWMSACLRSSSSQKSRLLALAVSIVISCSIAAMDIATKGWAAALREGSKGLESPFLYVCFLIQAFFFIVSKWGMIYGCGRCDVLLFVPMNIVLNILFSVTAGMVVLGEASQVSGAQAWVGVIASCVTVAAGILLLVTGPAESEDLGGETSTDDTGQSDSEDVGEVSSSLDVAAAREGDAERVSPSRGIQALCLSTSQTSALAGLNRLHIRAARSRHHWRQQVFGHLGSRFGAEAPAQSPISESSSESEGTTS